MQTVSTVRRVNRHTVSIEVDVRLLKNQYSQVAQDVAKMSRRYKPLPLYLGVEELLVSLYENLRIHKNVLVTGRRRGGSFKARKVR